MMPKNNYHNDSHVSPGLRRKRVHWGKIAHGKSRLHRVEFVLQKRAQFVTVSALALILCITGAWAADAETLGTSIVANGSFEQASGATPDFWQWGAINGAGATFATDPEIAHSGSTSVRIASTSALKPNVYGGVYQTISGITPGSEYVIRVWAKGSGVGTCWFGGGPGWAARKAFPKGDFDWQQFELRWKAGPADTSFHLRVNVDSATTALWIDDITLQEINPLDICPRARVVPFSQALAYGYLLMPQLTSPLSIDADLADWPASAKPFTMPGDSGTVKIRNHAGDEDLSATIRMAWDANNLYFAAQVRDNIHYTPQRKWMWENDSIQLGFDPLHERTQGQYGPNDSEYSIALNQAGDAQIDCWHSADEVGPQSLKFNVATSRTGDITTYEAAIPWSAIGVHVGENGPLFGFSMLINDNDGDGRRGWLELTSGMGRSKNPADFLTALNAAPGALALTASGATVYRDQPFDLTAILMPDPGIPSDAAVTFTASSASSELASVPLPAAADGFYLIQARVPADHDLPSLTKLSATVSSDNNTIATAHAQVTVSGIRAYVLAGVEQVRKTLAATETLAAQVEAQNIATDYERVVIATAREFVEYALQDLNNGRPARAKHVVDVLDAQLTQAASSLRSYLDGSAKPKLVPRFVTSPVEIRGGTFWGETITPSTGEREKRPIFFTGYGHFGSVVRDLPKFPDLGANIIQIEAGPTSTMPTEGALTTESLESYVVKALALGEKYNVQVCWLASPHYFPSWALDKWPELKMGTGGFFRYTVDAPQARDIVRTHIDTSMRALAGSDALNSVCLSNEPIYTDWQNDPFRRELWHAYLKRIHGSIDALNEINGTSFKAFDEIPVAPTDTIPEESGMTPLRYDQLRFNMEQFAEFHEFMADTVHASAPKMPTHAKVMPVPSSRDYLTWGCDPEQFAYATDLNGNDSYHWFREFGEQYAAYWLGQNLYFDIQRSMRLRPIINSENHIIIDREQRLIPAAHTDCALWQGALHGQGAAINWVWERSYDQASAFEGSIMHRPENVIAAGNAGLDLMRLAPEVAKLQRAKAPVAILYSLTAQLWSSRAHDAMKRSYEALCLSGLPVHFISEKAACDGDLRRYSAVICPAVRHLPDPVYDALKAYANQGGQLWMVGSDYLGRDQYNRPRTVDLPSQAVRTIPEHAITGYMREAFVNLLNGAGVSRPIIIRDLKGRDTWGIEYRAVPEGADYLLSVANYWGTPQTVRLTLDGHPVSRMTDLRTGETIDGDKLSLASLQCTILRVERDR